MVDLEPIQDLLKDSLYDYEDDESEDDTEEISDFQKKNQDGGAETTTLSSFNEFTPIAKDIDSNSTLVISEKSENRVRRSSGNPILIVLYDFKSKFVLFSLEFDPAIDLYPEDYCPLIEDLTTQICLENSLLGETQLTPSGFLGNKKREFTVKTTINSCMGN